MADAMWPGDVPVTLNEARSWLRLGATIDDAVVAGLVRAATNICEMFVGQWLIVRGGEAVVPAAGNVKLSARPVAAVDAVALILPDGGEQPLGADEYRVTIARDGAAVIAIHDPGEAVWLRIAFRAGMAATPNGVPEAVRQGIVRMTQHLHDARDGAGAAPPAAIAALWQPWRLVTLGGAR